MSTSTCSVPTTPAHLNVPFPDQPYAPFAPEAVPEYPSIDSSYNNFANYQSYTQDMVQPDYRIKDTRDFPSGLLSNQDFGAHGASVSREHLDLSMFMAPLPHYSL